MKAAAIIGCIDLLLLGIAIVANADEPQLYEGQDTREGFTENTLIH